MGVFEWVSYCFVYFLIGLLLGIVEGIWYCGVLKEWIIMVLNGCDLVIFDFLVELWCLYGVLFIDLMVVFVGMYGMVNGFGVVFDVVVEFK